MRLKYVYISEYKNLKNFSLNFDSNSFIDIFVGKNGSGKSNFLEALILIFQHLYKKKISIFDYKLTYEINGHEIKIECKEDNISLDNNQKDIKKLSKKELPENILIYYSGHNKTVKELINEYEKSFRKKNIKLSDSIKFIFIGSEYKNLLLSLLLLQPDNNEAKKHIIEKLGIKNISHEIKIVLKRPFYAKNKPKDYIIDIYDDSTKYWKITGKIKIFLDNLFSVKNGDPKNKVRDEGYIPKDGNDDKYIKYFDVNDFQNKFKDKTLYELFILFNHLKILEMLEEISLDVKLKNDKEININLFSDGQFQSLYIYTITEIFKEKNCITLLDEPDSFLHPEWQFQFLQQIFDISEKTPNNNHILMCSHSAITLIKYNEKKIKLFNFKDKKLCCHDVNKSYAIKNLSDEIIRYTEKEQILSILNTITIENKPVFFTEGSTDPIIIKEAWQKLYSSSMPFIPIYAFSCEYLRRLLQDERIINESGKKPIFGLFDFDEAYNQWNSIEEDKEFLGKEIDPYKGLLKKAKDKNVFAFMLPVPNIEEIELLVIKDKLKKETFLSDSKMGIEHLFYSEKTKDYFEKEHTRGGGIDLIFKEKMKSSFAKDTIPKLDKKYFEVFRPMFEFIKSKCK